ncbi:MAG: TM2 domain-containing protein [Bacilli bacterium]|nr:TM2 domain-containing protein [Bacilli bacterium]
MAKFCQKCGTELKKDDTFCSNCGAPVESESKTTTATTTSTSTTGKSKMAAGLLGIFLGCFGVHNFYLGYTGKAVGQLLLTLIGWIACGLGPIAAWIWSLIEGIMILSGSINTDAEGNELID